MAAAQPPKRSKLSLLLRLLRRNRGEAWDRVLTLADFQTDRLRRKSAVAPVSSEDCWRRLGKALHGDVKPFLQEDALLAIEQIVTRGREELSANPAFGMFHGADFSLARLCYAICRLRRPANVVETGVAHGVSSAFLLQALAVNGTGELWSIDLPPLAEGADDQVGWLVPAELRSRWHLLRGRTRDLLPSLVVQLPAIDLFLHDSLHTYRNITREFQTVWPKLPPGGVLLSDDVNMNRAFDNFAKRPDIALALTSKEENKDSVFGAIVKAER
jgi:predicted O-methyltransferase YrrM